MLWLEYKRACPEGFQYSKFCSLLATEQRIWQATMANLEHNPADMMQVDFAGEPLFYFNASLEQVVKALNNCLT